MVMLNQDQQAVVNHRDGASIVLASAGSGKTLAVVNRMQQLIQDGVSPERIIAVTFSRAAADSMKQRANNLLGANSIQISTFHSIGAKICKEYEAYTGINAKTQIVQDWEQRSHVTKALEEIGLEYDVKMAIAQISRMKKNLISADEALNWLAGNGVEYAEELAELYAIYNQQNRAKNKWDFDDMIFIACKLLMENNGIQKDLAARYDYAMLDEAQDTNLAQFTLISLILPANRIMLIGDDFQSIYAFQGANPEVTIFGFHREHKAQVFLMQDNYRSHSGIIDHANKLTEYMDNPFGKTMIANKDDSSTVDVKYFVDYDREARYMVDEIMAAKAAHPEWSWNDFAVLYRISAMARPIEEALILNEIPYVVYGSTSFFKRPEVQHIIAYLKLAVDPNKYHWAVKDIINIASSRFPTATRRLGKVFVDQLVAKNKNNLWAALNSKLGDRGLSDFQRRGIEDCLALVRDISQAKGLHGKLNVIIDKCYMRYLVHELGIAEDEDDSRIGILNEIRNVFMRFREPTSLIGYFNKMAMFEKRKEDPDFKGVQVMTVHRSKGLEFNFVGVTGAVDCVFPHIKSGEVDEKGFQPHPEKIKEERRLMYVAVSRAIKHLVMTGHENGIATGTQPSMFLQEMGYDKDALIQAMKAEVAIDSELVNMSAFVSDDPEEVRTALLAEVKDAVEKHGFTEVHGDSNISDLRDLEAHHKPAASSPSIFQSFDENEMRKGLPNLTSSTYLEIESDEL